MASFYDQNGQYKGYSKSSNGSDTTYYHNQNGKYTGYSTSDGSNTIYYHDKNGQYKGYSTSSNGSDTTYYHDQNGKYTGYSTSDGSNTIYYHDKNGQYGGYSISSDESNMTCCNNSYGQYIGCSTSSRGQASIEDIPWWFVLIGCGVLLIIFALPFLAVKVFIAQADNYFSERNKTHICYSDEIHLTGSNFPNKYACFAGTLEPGEYKEYTIVTEENYLTLSFEIETYKEDSSVDIKIIREDGYSMSFNSSHSDNLFFIGNNIQLPNKGTYIVRISTHYQAQVDYSIALKGYISLDEDK